MRDVAEDLARYGAALEARMPAADLPAAVPPSRPRSNRGLRLAIVGVLALVAGVVAVVVERADRDREGVSTDAPATVTAPAVTEAAPPDSSSAPTEPAPSNEPVPAPFAVELVPGGETGFPASFAPGPVVVGPVGMVVEGTHLGAPVEGDVPWSLWWSADGRRWEAVDPERFAGSPVAPPVASTRHYLLPLVEDGVVRTYTSSDGRDWGLVAEEPLPEDQGYGALLGAGGQFFRFTSAGLLTSYDGSEWFTTTLGLDGAKLFTSTLAATDDGYVVYAHDETAGLLASAWSSGDGREWTPMAAPPPVALAGLAGSGGGLVAAFRDRSLDDACPFVATTVAPGGCELDVRFASVGPSTGYFRTDGPPVFVSSEPWSGLRARDGMWTATQRVGVDLVLWSSTDAVTWTSTALPDPGTRSWVAGIEATGAGGVVLLDEQGDDEPAAAVIITATGTATADRRPPEPPPPPELEQREVLRSCGEFATTTHGLTDADHEKVACILEAFQAGQPAELVYERPGTEGGRLRIYLRVLGPGRVEEFGGVLEDPMGTEGWYRLSCARIDIGDPFGFPASYDCAGGGED